MEYLKHLVYRTERSIHASMIHPSSLLYTTTMDSSMAVPKVVGVPAPEDDIDTAASIC